MPLAEPCRCRRSGPPRSPGGRGTGGRRAAIRIEVGGYNPLVNIDVRKNSKNENAKLKNRIEPTRSSRSAQWKAATARWRAATFGFPRWPHPPPNNAALRRSQAVIGKIPEKIAAGPIKRFRHENIRHRTGSLCERKRACDRERDRVIRESQTNTRVAGFVPDPFQIERVNGKPVLVG